jgi:hypothetical protein
MFTKILLFLLCASQAAFATDLIVLNANVITVDSSRPYAEAFAIEDGRFISVGSNADVLKFKTAATKIVDLHGETVLPGFNDVHLHPQAIFAEGTPHYRVWLGADRVHSMDDVIAELKRQAKVTPAGKLINGYGYNDVALGRHPNRHDLDKVSTTQPIIITHGSGHITVVNSFVLQAAGITKDTQDPPGGALDRDPDGTPNGVIRESARHLISHAVDSDSRNPPSHQDELDGYMTCFRQYSAKGITSAGIAGAGPSTFEVMQELRDRGNPIRIGFMFSADSFDKLEAAGIRSGLGDDRLRVTALKTYQGNSLSGRTAWLSEAYSDRPGYFGIPPARTQEQLDADYQKWWDAGWQVATHSNGDREIDMVLTAIERAEAKDPRPNARWRIEHASVMNQALLDRAKKDGVVLVFHSYMWEYGDILQSYGPKRLSMMHAYRTAIDEGIPVAGHSDSPISAADPLLRIQDMVTRTSSHGLVVGPNQRIGVEEAIKVWTLDGAYATFEENTKGSVTPGKLADFVVLAADPRKVAPDTIKDIRLQATYLGGKEVYQAPLKMVAMVPQPPINYGDGNYGDGDEEENQTQGK